ncbi:MAG TPA: bifunctional phosphopantothenoylcysteine decarboxylase/phosphopantothenate--cysteine ligase CoaBC [Polyangiaceae bacterium]|jgi:phosphopantothenoylcysteine decarboxylase/phosphopantothenate--cysteine ligase|nr:bifunctional phosphopantothenoylcysteine decarboxylase/phosphopantothenate--cysteine ligase CoaBC [Polyangiaceae bacterium]
MKRTVVLGVSGSIAAYKAAEVARLLVKGGVRVVPMMTASAQRFLGAATLSGICGGPVYTDMFEHPGEIHVELGASADVIALVPATAELIAALAQGRADDLLRATVLCARGRVVLAPAMHPRMWRHPATQRNVELVRRDGVELVGPVEGEVASGDIGMGRMAEPEAIAQHILGARDLDGLHVVVSAGPTVEDLDPARFLSNRSSGKMGFALAERAAARGATVTLVAGPVALDTPSGVLRTDVRSALEMRKALHDAIASAHALIMCAAVADYRPVKPSVQKLKRGSGNYTLELVPNPDLLAEIGGAKNGLYLVGFALETVAGDELVKLARQKLTQKKVDLVVANRASDAFERDDNVAVLVTANDAEPLPPMPKRALADRVLDRVRDAAGRAK